MPTHHVMPHSPRTLRQPRHTQNGPWPPPEDQEPGSQRSQLHALHQVEFLIKLQDDPAYKQSMEAEVRQILDDYE